MEYKTETFTDIWNKFLNFFKRNKHKIKRKQLDGKWYLVDTNVLFNSPEIMKEYNCVIPSHVLREVEHLELTRKQDKTLQWQIRRFKNILDDSTHAHVDLTDYKFNLRDDWDGNYTDNILVQICVEEGYGLLSHDRLLKDKCRMYDIDVVDLQQTNFTNHKGFKEIHLLDEEVNEIYRDLGNNKFDLMINEYLIIYNDIDGKLMDVFKWDGRSLIRILDNQGSIGKGFRTDQFERFEPKDVYQAISINSTFNHQVTSIRGRAGTGKSLIALNVAWKLHEMDGYKIVIFVNPTASADSEELGYYKGDKLEKLMQSSVGSVLKSKFGSEIEVYRHITEGTLDIMPFADLRGYDTGEQKVVVWILESQNLTSELLKMGLQRISENTKVIVDGDYHQQIDKQVYSSNNGMMRMSEVLRGDVLYGEVELQNVYRSRLADIVDKM